MKFHCFLSHYRGISHSLYRTFVQKPVWVFILSAVMGGHVVFAQTQLEPSTEQAPYFEEEIVPQRYTDHPAVNTFISEMAAHYDFDTQALRLLFARTHYAATSVKLVMPAAIPAQRNWRLYRSQFLDEAHIEGGIRFWRTHRTALQRAYHEFGVPPEIIVAIIGIESRYGRQMGNFRVLDVLTTLAFDYPPTPNQLERSRLFRKNLEDFLLWTRNARLEPEHVLGSYAGAIGIPQFMPSSILQYAISDEPDRMPDLSTSVADSISSVANYLRQHGWVTLPRFHVHKVMQRLKSVHIQLGIDNQEWNANAERYKNLQSNRPD